MRSARCAAALGVVQHGKARNVLPQRHFSAAAKTVRIGGASGFWGDTAVAAPQLLRGGGLDYLVFDYLAETTMAILAKMHERDSSLGYARDFVAVTMKDIAKTCKSSGVKVIANAGGVNPLACKAALEAELDKQGVDLKVGVVLGDDLSARADELRPSLGTVDRFDGMGVFPQRPLSMNAYLGARPIANLLGQGCDVVVTGRTVDSAVTLGACMHEFGWNDDEYDALAGATLAGHVIECGAQATGGLFTDWEVAADGWFNIGYPVATVEADGAFTISKPPGTGGVLSVGAVAEQLLYEIGDPGAYHVPDVACDWTQVQIEQEPHAEAIRVSHAKGQAPTGTYKVTTTYFDGFRSEMAIVVQGIDADRKAHATANALFRRQRLMLQAMGLPDYTETSAEVLGAEHVYGANRVVANPREVVLRMAARHPDKRGIELFGREIASAATSMAPGTMPLLATGRPTPAPLVRVFNAVIPKSQVPVAIAAGKGAADAEPVAVATEGGFVASASESVVGVSPAPCDGATVRVPLVRLCYGRSGDKGNTVNIGLVARKPEYLPFLRAAVTESAVADYFAHAIDATSGRVTRYDLPGVHAMNFVMTSALGGGGTSSIRVDSLAKGFAQQLLSMEIDAPAEWALDVDAA